jgi:tRNA pseudouridine55 synthase
LILSHSFTPDKEAYLEGQVLLIDKPEGPSAFGVVKRAKYLIERKYKIKKLKVGHAGTLDPLATGLMVLCTGKATKTINELMGDDKVYSGSIKMGITTPSWDRETEEENPQDISQLTLEDIKNAAEKFSGEIEQIPPLFSALRKDGKRLYEMAREGSDYIPEARKVQIFSFEITDYQAPLAFFKVHVSKGTYIRSLAKDMGDALGVGAYLNTLRREQSGVFDIADALSYEELEGLL